MPTCAKHGIASDADASVVGSGRLPRPGVARRRTHAQSGAIHCAAMTRPSGNSSAGAKEIAPHALTIGQRLSLLGVRGALGVFGVIPRVRRRRLAGRTEVHRYGARKNETLEVIEPPVGSETAPVPIVYIHGGGWIFGNKELYSTDLEFLSERGHRVFNLDYPLAPEHPFPRPLISLLEALSWIHSRYPDATRIHLMGDSAGGNLAMMLGLLLADPDQRAGVAPELDAASLPDAASIISIYGVLDRTSWIEHAFPGARLMLHSYGGAAAFEAHVGPELALCPLDLEIRNAPPTFLGAGTEDPLAESSRLGYDALEKRGVSVELKMYEGENHGFFNMAWRPNSAQLRADISAFLDRL
jgi:acetyl esterase